MPPFDSLRSQFHSFLPRGFRWRGISSISSGDRQLPSIADCGEPHSQLNLRSLDLQLNFRGRSRFLWLKRKEPVRDPSAKLTHFPPHGDSSNCCQYIEDQQLPSVDFLLLGCDSIDLAQGYQGLHGIDLGVPLRHRGGLSRSFCLLVCPGDRSWDWCLPCWLFVDLGYFHID